MPIQIPELEARLIEKRILRLEAAKAELSKSKTLPYSLWAWALPWGVAATFGEQLARYFGVSTQLVVVLCTLFGLVTFAIAQTLALERKVQALNDILNAGAEDNRNT